MAGLLASAEIRASVHQEDGETSEEREPATEDQEPPEPDQAPEPPPEEEPPPAPEQPQESTEPTGEETKSADGEAAPQETEEAAKDEDGEQVSWRDDPSVKRHPGSYIGVGAGYAQVRAWVEANEDHGDLEFGPFHTWYASLRVGDAFAEWFALGFQVEVTNTTSGKEQVGAFNLMLDASFYPIAGLGIRPALGLGLGFANGKEEWEFGGGGPGCFSLSVLYEFRILRLFAVAPVAQAFWITGQGFDGLFLFFGLEFIKWFETPTG